MTLRDVLALYHLDLEQEIIAHRYHASREAVEKGKQDGWPVFEAAPIIDVHLTLTIPAPR